MGAGVRGGPVAVQVFGVAAEYGLHTSEFPLLFLAHGLISSATLALAGSLFGF